MKVKDNTSNQHRGNYCNFFHHDRKFYVFKIWILLSPGAAGYMGGGGGMYMGMNGDNYQSSENSVGF